jgi:PAS domain S-box-containing protein
MAPPVEASGDPDAIAREKLRRSEGRFRLALAHSGVVVFEHDRELRYTWIFPTQFYDESLVLGRTDADLFPEADARRLMDLKREVLRTGARLREEVQVTVDGRRHEFVLTVDPVCDADGRVVGLTGASSNISEAKEAQGRLAEALEFRDKAIGMLGHDLRDPLNAIYGWTHLLLAQKDREDERGPLLRIARSVKRMAEMIGSLLDFAECRFRDGLEVRPAPADLSEVLRAVVEELAAAHPGRRIRLVTDGDARGTWDAGRLAQVASNLVGNALKHGAPEGVVQVRVRAENDGVALEVENEGSSIPEEIIPDLFKPFQAHRSRLQNSASGRERSLGLGLFISQQIVRAHAGAIAVAARQEGGTIFRVHLPRAAESSAPSNAG